MNKNNAAIAYAYYTAMKEKNIDCVAHHLHADVQLQTPFVHVKGKTGTLEAIERFMTLFTSLSIQAHFGTDAQAMVAYDVEFPAPIGKVPTAGLLSIQDGLISKIQLFFDTQPFNQK